MGNWQTPTIASRGARRANLTSSDVKGGAVSQYKRKKVGRKERPHGTKDRIGNVWHGLNAATSTTKNRTKTEARAHVRQPAITLTRKSYLTALD